MLNKSINKCLSCHNYKERGLKHDPYCDTIERTSLRIFYLSCNLGTCKQLSLVSINLETRTSSTANEVGFGAQGVKVLVDI